MRRSELLRKTATTGIESWNMRVQETLNSKNFQIISHNHDSGFGAVERKLRENAANFGNVQIPFLGMNS